MKNKFVVEVINDCCFQHGDPTILKRFSTKNEALVFVYDIKKMSIKETEKFKLWDRFITGIRVLDTTNYPPQDIYEVEMEGFIVNYDEGDIPSWSEIEAS